MRLQIRQFYVWSIILSYFILKQKEEKTFTVPCEKHETVSFASSNMKNIVACCSRFPIN